jgi:methylated-DNA-protein-cysteine methyltransferase-like protein
MKNEFIEKVLYVVKNIPFGKVTTYGAIGKFCGIKFSARMVGWVLSKNALNNSLPFHRVVNRNGALTGKYHFLTPFLMKELLIAEGIKFSGENVIIKEYFWDPSEHLNF